MSSVNLNFLNDLTSQYGATETLDEFIKAEGPNITVDGKPYDLNMIRGLMADNGERNFTDEEIITFMNKGVSVDYDIDSAGDAALAGVGSGGLGILGAPVDIVNSITRGIEDVTRAGFNKLASINAPEGVDDPNSPNYDPDFYLSRKPEDFIFSSTTPFGGKESIATGLETTYALVGSDFEYKLDKMEIPEEYRYAYVMAEIAAENAPIVFGLPVVAATKAGSGKPIHAFWDEIIKDPKKFIITESAATSGGAGLVGIAEQQQVENPYARMGIEFLGNIIGGASANPKSILETGMKGALKLPIVGAVLKGQSKSAARISAFQELKRSLNATHKGLLKKSKELKQEAANAQTVSEREAFLKQAEAAENEAGLYELSFVFNSMEKGYRDIYRLAEGQDIKPIDSEIFAGNFANNPAVVELQKYFSNQDTLFDAQVIQNAQDSIKYMLSAAEAMARGGNPEAAQVMTNNAYQQAVNMVMIDAQDKAQKLLQGVRGNIDQQAVIDASIQAQKIISEARQSWSGMEDYLWQTIPTDIMVENNKFIEEIRSIYSGPDRVLFSEQSVTGSGELDAVLSRLGNADTISLGDLKLIRSQLLQLARTSSSGLNPDFRASGIYSRLANSTLKDITNSNIPENILAEFNLARAFSSRLHDRFDTGFNAELLNLTGQATSDLAMTPEMSLTRAYGGGGIQGKENLEDMQVAASETDKVEAAMTAKKVEDDAVARGVSDDDPIITPAPSSTSVVRTEGPMPYTPPNQTAFPFKPMPETSRMVIDEDGNVVPDPRLDQNNPQFRDNRPRTRTRNDIFPPEGSETADTLNNMFGFNRENSPEVDPPKDLSDAEINSQADEIYGDGPPEEVVGGEVAVADTPTPFGPRMSEAQETFLRNVVYTKLLDSKTVKTPEGDTKTLLTLSPEKVRQWKLDNEALLSRFPDLATDIDLAIDARRVMDRMDSELSAIAEGNLSQNINDIFTGNVNRLNRLQELKQVASSVANQGDNAPKAALRNSIMDYIFRISERPSDPSIDYLEKGSPNFQAIAKNLLTPINDQGMTLLDALAYKDPNNPNDYAILQPDEMAAVARFLQEGINIENSLRPRATADDVITPTSDLQTNLARIVGANIGAMFGDGGASLQTAQIVSGQFKKLVSSLPLANQKKAMQDLLKSPRILVGMYKRDPSVRLTSFQAYKESIISRYNQSGARGVAGKLAKDATMGVANVVADGITNTPVSARLGSTTVVDKGLPDDAVVQTEEILSEEEEEE